MRFCQAFSRTQEIYWVLYFSQIFTDKQKPFSEQGEHAEKWWLLPSPQLAPPPSPTGPSPFPSPEGRGVITEIPL